MPKILVTGGAGYIGSILLPKLLGEGHQVTIFDSLLYGGSGLTPHITSPSLEFIKGDIRDMSALEGVIPGQDVIIHLAALVGLPACSRDPWLAQTTNVDGTGNVVDLLSRDQLLIHASTVSNYGACKGDICDETTPLNPLSCYGRTKSEAEDLALRHPRTVCLRFATAFGVSPRMRFDLLINDFVHQAYFNGYLILFEKSYTRTFIHVDDIAESILFALDNSGRMIGSAFNAGDDANNFSKEQIAAKIKDRLEYYLHFADIGADEDKRDYKVSYARLNGLGFHTEKTVDEGIDEVIKACRLFETPDSFKNS